VTHTHADLYPVIKLCTINIKARHTSFRYEKINKSKIQINMNSLNIFETLFGAIVFV